MSHETELRQISEIRKAWGSKFYVTHERLVGYIFRQLREAAGINPGYMAYTLGISVTNLVHIEDGLYPSTSTDMLKFCSEIGAPPEKIFALYSRYCDILDRNGICTLYAREIRNWSVSTTRPTMLVSSLMENILPLQ